MPVGYSKPPETELPGVTRRRVWAHPELASHALAVLTFERLHVGGGAGAPAPEVLAAVEAGGDLAELLGPAAVVIEVAAIRRLRLDLLTNSLAIDYAKADAGAGRLVLTFATPEAADACFTRLWRRLPDGFALQPYKRDAWSAARAPLVLLIGSLLTAALLALVLSVHEDTASVRAAARAAAAEEGVTVAAPPESPLDALLDRLDWRWVCAAGGALAAVAQVWLYRRLTLPPVALELTQSPGKSPNNDHRTPTSA